MHKHKSSTSMPSQHRLKAGRSTLPKVQAALLTGMLAALSLTGCGHSNSISKPLVTDVAQSSVKRQSIGNCWIYAEASWLEAEIKTATGTEVNVSESYWTWWHWYDQIVGSSISELETGGSWETAAAIITAHGYVLEGEFIPTEADAEMSQQQLSAQNLINSLLKSGGALADPAKRTPAKVRAALDKAFSTVMADAESKARPAASAVIGKLANGNAVTLADALNGDSTKQWQVVYYPRLYGQATALDADTAAARRTVMRRALKALNDHAPVVISLMIDFNALDVKDATFKKALQDTNGVGRQGGHMVVLEDYVVDNAPGFGHLGEGDMTPAQKAAALDGDLVTLKAKNSWGKNRPDRGLIDGYTSFDEAYLNDQLAWKNTEDGPANDVSYYTTLEEFVIPPGY